MFVPGPFRAHGRVNLELDAGMIEMCGRCMKRSQTNGGRSMRSTYLVPLFAAATLACGESTTPTVFKTVQVSFATQAPGSGLQMHMLGPGAMMDDTSVVDEDTLILGSVEIVLREIELQRLEVNDCDMEPEPEGCEKFEAGPVLVSLPLGSGADSAFALDIPPGTYTEIEFDVHKVSDDDEEDAAFRQAHPEFVDKSIRATGTFNGQAFVFESDLNVEQELRLIPALVIEDATTTTNITILVDVGGWFRDEFGGLIDPATANKGFDNEGVVKDNIENSIDAFEDEDEDGREG